LGRHAFANLNTSNGCQDHTPSRPQQCRSSGAPLLIAHELPRPATSCAHDIVASTASRPTFVTIAIRPSQWDGMARPKHRFLKTRSAIFFAGGLDRPNHVDAACKIRFFALAFLRARRVREASIIVGTRSDLPVGLRAQSGLAHRVRATRGSMTGSGIARLLVLNARRIGLRKARTSPSIGEQQK
jgi:hypothetical protein